MIEFTARRMAGSGTDHAYISNLRWLNPSTQETGNNTTGELVDWLNRSPGQAKVRDPAGNQVLVGVVKAQPPYLRSYADGVWTDNLLALPLF